MCRYILATPANPADTNHNVRVIFGNGLRPQIWPQFINRFKIPKVAEFYGATEGNANIGENSFKNLSFSCQNVYQDSRLGTIKNYKILINSLKEIPFPFKKSK